MLKYFYKTILISFICGSLLMLDFVHRGNSLGVQMNSARAETVSTGGVTDSNLMATLTMVGISVIASRLIQYGKLTPDIMIAAAGGAAFMAGDIMATNDLKKAKAKIETDIQRGKNGDITDEQRMYLIRLIQMYRAAKDAASTKKTLQTAAAAAFGAAAIAAYMQAASEETAEAACKAAVLSAQSAATAGIPTCQGRWAGICAGQCAGTGYGYPACYAACYNPAALGCTTQGTSCAEGIGAINVSFPAYSALRKAPSLSCTALSSVNAERTALTTSINASATSCAGTNIEFPPTPTPAMSACNSVLPLHIGYESGCLPPAMLYAGMAASVLMMGITASTLVTAVVSFSTPISTVVDTAIFMPMRRAVMWGVLAGLSFAASSATANVIAELEGNITKLEALVNNINIQANGDKGSNALDPKNSGTILGSTNNKSITVSGSGAEAGSDLKATNSKLPCLTSANGSNCPSFSSQMQALPAVTGDGIDSLTTNLSTINSMADGINGTSKVSGATVGSAAKLAGNANAIMAGLKKVKADAQKRLIDSGSTIDLNKDEKALTDQINKAMEDAAKTAGTNRNGLLAAYGSSAGTSGAMSDYSKMTEDELKKLAAKNSKLAGINLPKLNAAPMNTAKPNFGLDLEKDKEKEKATETAAAENKGPSMDDYEIKNDINTDKGSNIFDVISTRYQKSGYPRLFKRLNE